MKTETVTSAKKMRAGMDALTMDNVMSVYSGAAGRCYCGCAGDHRYNSKYIKEAGKDRGYAIVKEEVNDRQVAKVIKLINAAEVVEGQDVCLTVVDGSRAYTAYFTMKERERRAAAAAPELLSTLKNCLANSRRLAEETGKTASMVNHFGWVESVIAKAGGK